MKKKNNELHNVHIKTKDNKNYKKSKLITIISIVIVIVCIAIGGIIHFYGIPTNSEIKLIRESVDNINIENTLLTSYNQNKALANMANLSEKDFEKHNYAFIVINDDTCSGKAKPLYYSATKYYLNVVVGYYDSCGICGEIEKIYLLELNKNINNPVINIKYKPLNSVHCNRNTVYKPIIYLYPEKDTFVNVKLGYKELLTTTYPKYNDGWNVLAKTNGDLIDSNGKTYYGLYWEGINSIKSNYSDGFVVSKDEIIPFLEEKLSLLGLNDREKNEFIIYWLPVLEKNNYNFIRFESTDEINKQMPLEVVPKPNTIIRVLMEYKPLDKMIDVTPQELKTQQRNGFTVVEWGGTMLEN